MLRFSGAGHSGSCHHPWGCRGQGGGIWSQRGLEPWSWAFQRELRPQQVTFKEGQGIDTYTGPLNPLPPISTSAAQKTEGKELALYLQGYWAKQRR